MARQAQNRLTLQNRHDVFVCMEQAFETVLKEMKLDTDVLVLGRVLSIQSLARMNHAVLCYSCMSM